MSERLTGLAVGRSPRFQTAQIDHGSCPELRAAYVALTGLAPLHGYTDRCNESSPDRRS